MFEELDSFLILPLKMNFEGLSAKLFVGKVINTAEPQNFR